MEQTLIEKLGFSSSEKVVIIHIDDMGMSHAVDVAALKCLDFGIASCGSVLVNSPWFLEIAAACRANPNYDLGVHLTLTSEYEFYRWRPLSSSDPKSGLFDDEGYLWHTAEEVVDHISPEVTEAEWRAQIQFALASGIDITHIDIHIQNILNPKYFQSYLNLVTEFRVPAFLPKLSRKEIVAMGLSQHADFYTEQINQLEASDYPLIDHRIIEIEENKPDMTKYYCKCFSEIKPGLTHLLFHAAIMSSELTAISPDTAAYWDQNFKAFTDERLKKCAEKYDLNIIGFRKIRDYFRRTNFG